MRDTLHNSRFTRMRYNLRIITYEIISFLCKTNPILSAVGGFQMNANLYNTMNYENKSNWTLSENKPNTNPIKPNLKRAKMNVNLYYIEDYRKKDDFLVRINKPNLVRRRRIPKMNVNLYILKDYRKIMISQSKKTNPIQSQFQTAFVSAKISIGSRSTYSRETPHWQGTL